MRYWFELAILASVPLDKRDWRWHLTSAFSQRLRKCTFAAVHTKMHRRHFQIYPLWRAFLNLCVYGECFHCLGVGGRPKRIKKFTSVCVSVAFVWMGPESMILCLMSAWNFLPKENGFHYRGCGLVSYLELWKSFQYFLHPLLSNGQLHHSCTEAFQCHSIFHLNGFFIVTSYQWLQIMIKSCEEQCCYNDPMYRFLYNILYLVL